MAAIYVKLISYYKPYENSSDNVLSELGQYQILVTFLCVLILKAQLFGGKSSLYSIVDVSLVLTNLSIPAYILFDSIKSYFLSKRSAIHDETTLLGSTEKDCNEKSAVKLNHHHTSSVGYDANNNTNQNILTRDSNSNSFDADLQTRSSNSNSFDVHETVAEGGTEANTMKISSTSASGKQVNRSVRRGSSGSGSGVGSVSSQSSNDDSERDDKTDDANNAAATANSTNTNSTNTNSTNTNSTNTSNRNNENYKNDNDNNYNKDSSNKKKGNGKNGNIFFDNSDNASRVSNDKTKSNNNNNNNNNNINNNINNNNGSRPNLARETSSKFVDQIMSSLATKNPDWSSEPHHASKSTAPIPTRDIFDRAVSSTFDVDLSPAPTDRSESDENIDVDVDVEVEPRSKDIGGGGRRGDRDNHEDVDVNGINSHVLGKTVDNSHVLGKTVDNSHVLGKTVDKKVEGGFVYTDPTGNLYPSMPIISGPNTQNMNGYRQKSGSFLRITPSGQFAALTHSPINSIKQSEFDVHVVGAPPSALERQFHVVGAPPSALERQFLMISSSFEKQMGSTLNESDAAPASTSASTSAKVAVNRLPPRRTIITNVINNNSNNNNTNKNSKKFGL